MSAITAAVTGGGSGSGGGSGGGGGWSNIMEKIKAKKAAAAGGGTIAPIEGGGENMMAKAQAAKAMAAGGDAGGNVPMHGEESHGGGAGPVGKGRGKMWGGIGSAMSGLFYKMPASGLKYKNSPIEKNFGSAEQRGFNTSALKFKEGSSHKGFGHNEPIANPKTGEAPLNKLSTFGVGASNKEKMGGVGANLLDK